LHYSLLALALVVLIRTLPLIRLPGLRTVSDEIIEHLALCQTVAAVAEALEVYTLLVAEVGGKPVCQVGHSVAVL
jgi:hypothetical protein